MRDRRAVEESSAVILRSHPSSAALRWVSGGSNYAVAEDEATRAEPDVERIRLVAHVVD